MRILIATGGTGGHIYPAVSLANQLIKEDKDKRGRKSGEIAKVIKNGIDSCNKYVSVKIVLDEVEAFKEAIREATIGDSIIVFYEKIEPLIEVIDKLNENKTSNAVISSI